MEFSKNKQNCVSSTTPVMNSIQYQMLKSIRNSIKTIVSESNGILKIQRMHHLNGTFKKFCSTTTRNNTEFTDIIFPGTSKEVLQGLPKNLKEILEWNELELDLMKISNNAAEVLENIKHKGKSQGDAMDEQSESILLPQIAQEALAKGIIEAVRALNRKVSQINAKISQPIASITADEASWDQLETSLVIELFQEQQVGVQYHFMGHEWTALIRNDLNRFISNEKMSFLSKEAIMKTENKMENSQNKSEVRMTWLENTVYIQENYAALAEALKLIHALPYELNLKSRLMVDRDVQCSDHKNKVVTTALLTPSRGCTMLLYFPKDSEQTPRRYDSRHDGSNLDSGISAAPSNENTIAVETNIEKRSSSNSINTANNRFNLYKENVSSSSSSDDDINKTGEVTTSQHLVLSQEIMDDLLVVHKSTELLNERTVTNAEYFALIFFIHGRTTTTTTT